MPPEHSRTVTAPRERTSAGGVVVRTDAGVEVCLIRPAGPHASGGCPRAASRAARRSTQAAVREVAEETGISGVVDDELGAIDYSFYSREQNSRIHKTVHYYLMHATGGDTADHDHEVSEARWVGLREALRLMTYPNEREMVRRAAEALGEALDA